MIEWSLITPFNQQVLLLVGVIILKVAIQRIAPHHPWVGFRFYCLKLAEKVNKSENSDNQKHIAGFVAVMITFAPLWIIAWLFESLVAVPILWQGFLLYLTLGAGDIFKISHNVAVALTANDNYKAKQLLAPVTLRDTSQLSTLGLAKATIEMQIITHLQQYLVVGILFLVFNPLVAFGYRLMLEMHYSWNTKRQQYLYFGAFADRIIKLVQWLPNRMFVLLALLLTVGQNFLLIWRLTMTYFFKSSNDCVLAFFAPAHNIRLGGVAMYDNEKLRRNSFNDNGRQPEPKDIIHTQRFIWRIYALFIVLLVGCSVISQLLTI
jgi:adenosylcobinamide-phosphate synthase